MDKVEMGMESSQKEEKLIEHKLKREYKQKRKWKRYKDLTYKERKHLGDREAIKDHFKQDVKNNPKMLKNLDFSKKSLHLVNKPDTPHNTTQYLTSNFSQGRNEKVSTVLSEFAPIYEDDDEAIYDYLNQADDYCIPGGSMKDAIPIENDRIAKFPSDENIITHENLLSCVEHIPRPRLYSDISMTESPTEDLDIEKYRRIIEQQEKMICELTNKLKNAQSKSISMNHVSEFDIDNINKTENTDSIP